MIILMNNVFEIACLLGTVSVPFNSMSTMPEDRSSVLWMATTILFLMMWITGGVSPASALQMA